MTVMLLFMFKWTDHDSAPKILDSLSLENVIMFALATPVQVQMMPFFSIVNVLMIFFPLVFVDHLWSTFL